jgi:NADPH:quinone reductase-like Zn-dependent oxidoreductase
MKAAFIEAQGGPEQLFYGLMPDPVAGPGQVLVAIRAASVNGADWRVRNGSYSKITTFPYILGRDFSGIVAEVADGVSDFKVGDEVFGVCAVGQEGAYAEKIAIDAAILAAKPQGFEHVEMAAVALIGLTAVVSIEDTLKLKAGETILIQGGAGGVGGFAVQLAKHIGAHVITTACAENHEYVLGLGADEVIDYKAVDFAEVVSGCDAVFDTVGGEVAMRTFAVLKPGGRAAFIASGGSAPPSPRPDVRSLRPKVGRDRKHLERIVELLEAGAVQVPEIRRFHLGDAGMAHRTSEGRHLRGKLVFDI